MKVDYIIVGCGLAGIAFCEQLRRHQKSFLVLDDASQQSSKVAGGIYNPVILKRFTPVWNAKELLSIAMPFYTEIEKHLQIKFNTRMPVLRAFKSVEEQNNWFAASDHPMMSEFIATEIVQNHNSNIHANYGLGKVNHTGRIMTATLIEAYTKRLQKDNNLLNATFNFDSLSLLNEEIRYKDIKAEHVVFAEGFGLKKNPYFNYLPLMGSHGEYIKIQAPDLKMDFMLKGSLFIIPLDMDYYLVGATYNNQLKVNTPTDDGNQELISKLKKMISCDFVVVDHIAGIRPTVKDRRPLVGKHPIYKNLSVLNGFGTRGVMIAPFAAQSLFDHLEKGIRLDPEIDATRYENLFIG